jgi:hypothetical protein
MVFLNLMGLSGWWLGKRFFIIVNCTLIDLTRSLCMPVAVDKSDRIYDDFLRLLFLHVHREASALPNEIPEETGQFCFLHADCLSNIKGSVGLILAKASDMRISIPLDLSSRSFIPLPRFIRSRRPTPLLAPSLVFSPMCSA